MKQIFFSLFLLVFFELSHAQEARDYLISGIRKSIGKEYKAAIKELKKAIDEDPDLADAYYELGKVYSKVGNNKKAAENCQF